MISCCVVRLVPPELEAGRRDTLVFSVTDEALDKPATEGPTELPPRTDARLLERERDLARASRMLCFFSSLVWRRLLEDDRWRALSTRLGLSLRLCLLEVFSLGTNGAGWSSTPRAVIRDSGE